MRGVEVVLEISMQCFVCVGDEDFSVSRIFLVGVGRQSSTVAG